MLDLKLSDATQKMTFSVASTAPWLSASPGSASLPVQITAAVDGSNLAVGTYNANLIFTVPGVTNTPITVPVALVVTPGASLVASPVSLTFGGGFVAGGTTTDAQTFQVASTAGATPFTAVFAGGTCGNFVTLSASSGTTPSTITATASTANQTSNCSGTITLSGAGVSAAQVSVTSAANGGPGLGQAPVINAVTNAASYATGSIAPGEMLSLFGTGLGLPSVGGPGGGGGFPGGGVPANAVQVLFDGTPGTILNSSATQVNVIAPFAIAGKSQTTIQVNLLGQSSPSVRQTVATAAPGLFTTASGRPAGIGNTPIAKGSTISLYMTGAGLLNPTATDGKTAGDATYKIVAPVTATIAGQSAIVTYAGAVPGALFGLYQVNVVVPDKLASGSADLVIKVGDVSSQNGVSIVVQ